MQLRHPLLSSLFLLSFHLSVSAEDIQHYMIQHDDKTVQNRIVAEPDWIRATDDAGYTPLHWAASLGRSQVAEVLLAQGASVDARTATQWALRPFTRLPMRIGGRVTPLHCATESAHLRIVEMLLASGADCHARDVEGATPADKANQQSYHVLFNLLVDFDEFLGAVVRNDLSKLQAMLNAQPNLIERRDRDGGTALHWAVRCDRCAAARALLERRAPISARDKGSATPLHLAAQRGNVEMAALLLDHNANVSDGDLQNFTALHHAAWHGRGKMVEYLTRRGAVVDARGGDGLTPLFMAVFCDHVEVTRLLLALGANPKWQTPEGFTPLHAATISLKSLGDIRPMPDQYGAGDATIVHLLMEYGASADVCLAKVPTFNNQPFQHVSFGSLSKRAVE